MEKLAKRSDARIGLTPNAKRKAVSNFFIRDVVSGTDAFSHDCVHFLSDFKNAVLQFLFDESARCSGIVRRIGQLHQPGDFRQLFDKHESDVSLCAVHGAYWSSIGFVPGGDSKRKIEGNRIFSGHFSSTVGISVAAGSTIWLFIFHPSIGLLNRVLGYAGISPIAWLTDSDWALISVSITSIWMGIGFNFIILLGGLQSIPEDIYESATIDGAGYWTKLFRITLPMVSPSLFFVIIVTVIHSFQSFGQIDILTQGGPAESTNLIVYSIFQNAFIHYKFGVASAQAIILFIVVLIVTVIQFKVGEKKVHYQ